MFDHFLITRFNSTVKYKTPVLSNDWVRYRLNIMTKVTLPSIKNQTNQNFKWIILVRKETPDIFKIEIEETFKDYIILYTTQEDIIKSNNSPFKNNIRRQWRNSVPQWKYNLYPFLQKQLIKDYCIQTRLDSDDALRKDFVEIIQNHAKENIENYSDAIVPFAINPQKGYCIIKDNIYEISPKKLNNFISLIRHKDDSERNIFDESHHRVFKITPKIFFINHIRTWLVTIHNKNEFQQLSTYFGTGSEIDLLKVRYEQNLQKDIILKEFGL